MTRCKWQKKVVQRSCKCLRSSDPKTADLYSYNVAKYNGEDLNLSLNLSDNIDKVTYRFLTEFCTPSCKWL